jgi:biotin carboxyl carrier protein
MMLFKAESQGTQYDLRVFKKKTYWEVGMRPEGGEWVNYKIPKDAYQYLDNTISLIFKNSSYLVDVVPEGTEFSVYTRGSYRVIKVYNDEQLLHESLKKSGNIGSGNELVAGMPGKVVKVFVQKGQTIKAGDPVLILEAMKMENEMKAEMDAVVEDVHVKAGENVERGLRLVTLKPIKKS